MRRAYPTIDMKATGRNIKRIMRAKGISVKEVQKYLGLSAPQGIYHWLDGRSMPTVDNLYALSELFLYLFFLFLSHPHIIIVNYRSTPVIELVV